MQGPAGNDPRTPVRAGDRRSADPQVRDWQKNTWYGPAPQNENPFDEPEDAPELRSSRSENVNEHLGDFWREETTGYGYTSATGQIREERAKTASGPVNAARSVNVSGSVNAARSANAHRKAKRKKGGGKIALRVLLVLAVLLGTAFAVLRFAVFAVRDIRVDGLVDLTAEEVIASSGVRLGDSILSLDEKTVAQRIGNDYRLQYRYLEKQLPSTVVIGVKEREACCWLTYCGIYYTMDKNRMVLFETESTTATNEETGETYELPQFQQLVEVKGLEIRSGCYVGQTMILNTTEQQLLFSNLFLEMKVLDCTSEILEADLSNPSSVLLTTRDGYIVALGDSGEIHQKLRSMLLVRQELIAMGERGGTINVSNPENPLYSPPSGANS